MRLYIMRICKPYSSQSLLIQTIFEANFIYFSLFGIMKINIAFIFLTILLSLLLFVNFCHAAEENVAQFQQFQPGHGVAAKNGGEDEEEKFKFLHHHKPYLKKPFLKPIPFKHPFLKKPIPVHPFLKKPLFPTHP